MSESTVTILLNKLFREAESVNKPFTLTSHAYGARLSVGECSYHFGTNRLTDEDLILASIAILASLKNEQQGS